MNILSVLHRQPILCIRMLKEVKFGDSLEEHRNRDSKNDERDIWFLDNAPEACQSSETSRAYSYFTDSNGIFKPVSGRPIVISDSPAPRSRTCRVDNTPLHSLTIIAMGVVKGELKDGEGANTCLRYTSVRSGFDKVGKRVEVSSSEGADGSYNFAAKARLTEEAGDPEAMVSISGSMMACGMCEVDE